MKGKVLKLKRELKKYGLNPDDWKASHPQQNKVLFLNRNQNDYYFEGELKKGKIIDLALKVS